MRNIDYNIIDSIEKIVSVAEEKKLPRTAELLRDASLTVLLEYSQKYTVIEKRKSIKASRISQNAVFYNPPTKLMQ